MRSKFEQAVNWSTGFLGVYLDIKNTDIRNLGQIEEAYSDSMGLRPQSVLNLPETKWKAAWCKAVSILRKGGKL